jgi:hypothetical protein
LVAAIAAQAVKYVAGQAFGVDPNQRRRFRNIPHLQDDGFFDGGADVPLESKDPEKAKPGREIGLGYLA